MIRKPVPPFFNWQLPEDGLGILDDKLCGLASPSQVPTGPGPHQNLQATRMFFDRSICGGTSYRGRLLSNKNQAIADIDGVGGSPWNYAEQKTPSLKVTYDRSVDTW